MFTKTEKYYYDNEAVKEATTDKKLRNLRSVWSINTQPSPWAHFATFPPTLIEPCIFASSRPGDFILDPFFGSGTVGVACERRDRKYIGIELNPEYVALAVHRLEAEKNKIVRLEAA
jgi:site-specific DNA-methyltransferase (cytosine-N4-specific)